MFFEHHVLLQVIISTNDDLMVRQNKLSVSFLVVRADLSGIPMNEDVGSSSLLSSGSPRETRGVLSALRFIKNYLNTICMKNASMKIVYIIQITPVMFCNGVDFSPSSPSAGQRQFSSRGKGVNMETILISNWVFRGKSLMMTGGMFLTSVLPSFYPISFTPTRSIFRRACVCRTER